MKFYEFAVSGSNFATWDSINASTGHQQCIMALSPWIYSINFYPDPKNIALSTTFVETMNQKTDVTKLWRTIKGIDGRAKREAENEAITFNGISFSSSKQQATKFNQQFNTSKLGRHTSSRETRVVTRETKRKPLEMVRTFTTDLVMKAIKSCRNSKAFGPDKLSIFHLKHLGPRAIEYITALFNLSATTCRIPAI